MEIIDKIVNFDEYCNKCEYCDLSEQDDPCFECLQYPVNEYSHKPTKFKAKDDTDGAKTISKRSS